MLLVNESKYLATEKNAYSNDLREGRSSLSDGDEPGRYSIKRISARPL